MGCLNKACKEVRFEPCPWWKKEMPKFYAELVVVLQQAPEMRGKVLETVVDIHQRHLRYLEMKPELATIHLMIKRREFEN
ncbi:MAG: hypothetical protein M2R45_00515 [Verrucomicrobia subdivision 3 bacterium]|nr:hypothetical protein [Limisphaerales bacterium]MCS1413608.1 hypothetical protein [Limisphaerales bacterium]